MYDTIEFDQSRILTTPHPEWREVMRNVADSPGHQSFTHTRVHGPTHVRVSGKTVGTVSRVYVPSLPALLYGHNARCLKTQADLDLALALVDLILDQISRPLRVPNSVAPPRVFRRVDIATQLVLPMPRILEGMQHARQPGARKDPELYGQETIVFPFTDQRVSIYSKQSQLREKERRQGRRLNLPPGPNVARVEAQLRGDRLVRWLGDPGSHVVTRLDFDRAYSALRQIMIGVHGRPVSGMNPRSMGDLMTRLALEAPDIFLWRLSGLSADHRKKVRAAVRKRTPAHTSSQLDWATLLPEGGPPEFVDIFLPGARPPCPDLLEHVRARLSQMSPVIASEMTA
ncbi:MAG: hypothetical protein IT577_15260 [Verrucomicrobiae bacterium]|nr:hypothetical protein [Verrucomicrobiae bacterium]